MSIPENSWAHGNDLAEFYEYARHSMSSGTLHGWPDGIEDRGVWTTIA